MNFVNGCFAECGLAPTVELNCTDGFIADDGFIVHVDWVAPGCQFDCKALWFCENTTASYSKVFIQ